MKVYSVFKKKKKKKKKKKPSTVTSLNIILLETNFQKIHCWIKFYFSTVHSNKFSK